MLGYTVRLLPAVPHSPFTSQYTKMVEPANPANTIPLTAQRTHSVMRHKIQTKRNRRVYCRSLVSRSFHVSLRD